MLAYTNKYLEYITTKLGIYCKPSCKLVLHTRVSVKFPPSFRVLFYMTVIPGFVLT